MLTRSTMSLGIAVALLALTAGARAPAQKWTPYEFKGPALTRYRIVSHEEQGATEVVYTLDIQTTGEKDAGGVELFKVMSSTETLRNKDEVAGADAFFGVSPILGMAPMLMLGNPLFGAMIGQMDLAVGEKMNFFGAGMAKVVRKETIAGLEGFVCELYLKDGEKDVLNAELTVHPDLSLPLRSRTYENGELRFELLLLERKKH